MASRCTRYKDLAPFTPGSVTHLPRSHHKAESNNSGAEWETKLSQNDTQIQKVLELHDLESHECSPMWAAHSSALC